MENEAFQALLWSVRPSVCPSVHPSVHPRPRGGFICVLLSLGAAPDWLCPCPGLCPQPGHGQGAGKSGNEPREWCWEPLALWRILLSSNFGCPPLGCCRVGTPGASLLQRNSHSSLSGCRGSTQGFVQRNQRSRRELDFQRLWGNWVSEHPKYPQGLAKPG